MVQSPSVSLSIMPQLAMPFVQSAAGGGGGKRRRQVVAKRQRSRVGLDGLAAQSHHRVICHFCLPVFHLLVC